MKKKNQKNSIGNFQCCNIRSCGFFAFIHNLQKENLRPGLKVVQKKLLEKRRR